MAIWTSQEKRFDHRPDYLREAMSHLEHDAASQVIVDLAGILTIRSSDLNDLIELQGKLRSQGRSLMLINVPVQIAEVFQVTRLDRLFEIEVSEETQLA